MAVVFILGLLLVVGMTRVDFLVPKYRVRAAGRELGARLKYLKSRAVSLGMPYYICYDVPNARYWVVAPVPIPPEELEAAGIAVGSGGAPPGLPPGLPPALAGLLGGSAPAPSGPPPMRYVETLVTGLPSGVRFTDVALGSMASSGLIQVEITPYASSRTHYVHIADEDRKRETTVKFNGLTGNVTFFDGYQPPDETMMEAD
jgi:hypothetical protein